MSAEHMRAWRQRQLAKGLCSRCGRHPVIPGFRTCVDCRSRRREEAEESRFRQMPPNEAARWRDLDAAMGEECKRCGLHGEHLCVTAADVAGRRYDNGAARIPLRRCGA